MTLEHIFNRSMQMPCKRRAVVKAFLFAAALAVAVSILSCSCFAWRRRAHAAETRMFITALQRAVEKHAKANNRFPSTLRQLVVAHPDITCVQVYFDDAWDIPLKYTNDVRIATLLIANAKQAIHKMKSVLTCSMAASCTTANMSISASIKAVKGAQIMHSEGKWIVVNGQIVCGDIVFALPEECHGLKPEAWSPSKHSQYPLMVPPV